MKQEQFNGMVVAEVRLQWVDKWMKSEEADTGGQVSVGLEPSRKQE